jgi:hypothetical protein
MNRSQRLRSKDLAGIQYAGLDGITESCISSIATLFGRVDSMKTAGLLTCGNSHGFLIWTEFDEVIAIKAGFGSGYRGEGPCGLAVALVLLQKHRVQIDEYVVDELLMERLSASCLLQTDIDRLEGTSPVRPQRWHDYVYDYRHLVDEDGGGLARHYSLAIPFGLVDDRIVDLAVDFQRNPDAAIIAAYRRLEDVFRKRTGLAGEGTRLFASAFLGQPPLLRWDVPDEGESKGRAQLFAGAYMAFRNARVHRELKSGAASALREFMLVNELYLLEAEAMTASELDTERHRQGDEKDALDSLQTGK